MDPISRGVLDTPLSRSMTIQQLPSSLGGATCPPKHCRNERGAMIPPPTIRLRLLAPADGGEGSGVGGVSANSLSM